jgi:hypothetical protein
MKRLITVLVITVTATMVGCASIEQRCLAEVSGVSEEMRQDYFNSCVQSKRQAAQAWSHIGDGLKNQANRKAVECTKDYFGNYSCE